MEDDLSENENDSNFEDDSSSTEDDLIRPTVSNDCDSEEGDDESGGEHEISDNDLASEYLYKNKKWSCDHKLQKSSFHIEKHLFTMCK